MNNKINNSLRKDAPSIKTHFLNCKKTLHSKELHTFIRSFKSIFTSGKRKNNDFNR